MSSTCLLLLPIGRTSEGVYKPVPRETGKLAPKDNSHGGLFELLSNNFKSADRSCLQGELKALTNGIVEVNRKSLRCLRTKAALKFTVVLNNAVDPNGFKDHCGCRNLFSDLEKRCACIV